MRRSICFCEPSSTLAGEMDTWSFIYTTAVSLPKGTKLKFNLGSQGRAIDWEIPEANLKKKENVIWVITDGSKPIQMKDVDQVNSYVPDYECTLPAKVPVGEKVTIVMGAPKTKMKGTAKKKLGTRSQTFIQRRKPFYLYVDPSGRGHELLLE